MADITKIDTFIQRSPHPAWLSTPQGYCVYANPALERVTGLNSDQINQADWRSFVLEEDRAVASASWQESLATGTPYRVQVRMRGSDGVPKCVELVAFGHGAGDDAELWLFSGLDVKSIAAQKRPELEAQLQATLNVIPAYTWYAGPSGALTFVNKRHADYFGLPKDHPLRFGIATGVAWDSHIPLLHPDDHEEARRVWSTCLSTGSAGEMPFRARNAAGEYRWFLTRAEPLRANDGTLLYWIGVNLDIDDAKRAEDALRKSEKELRDVIDTIPAMVWSTLPDGSNTYVNKRFVEYTGSSAEQVAGSGWQALVHPDDLERHAGKWMEAVATGKPHENEVRSRRSDGQYRWQLDRGLPLRDEDGNIVKWYGVTTDIEDRKRAEEAFRQNQFYLSEGQRLAHMGSWAFNATGFTYWSPELFQAYGLDSRDNPPTLEEYLTLVHPEDRGFMEQGIAKMLDDHLAFDFTKRIVRPDGEIRHIRCVGVPVTPGGSFQGFVGTGMDVTDQERLTEELRLSEHYLSEGQRLAHMGSWAFNPSGFFSHWSRELLRIYGLDPAQEAPNLEEYLALIHPRDREFMRSLIKKMVAEALGCDVTKRIVRPDGEIRYIRCVGVPVIEDGTLQRIIGTAMDVTEHELLTQELRRREAYLAEAQRLSHTGSFGWTPDSGEIVWSDETYRIFDYDHAVRPTIDLVVQRVHPDDRPGFLKVAETSSAGATQFEHTYRLLLPDGSVKHVHVLAHALQDPSGNRQFVGAVTDITSIKRAEEDLRTSEGYLVEAQRLSHTGSWAWSPGGFMRGGKFHDIRYWSEECYRVLSFDPQDGLPRFEDFFRRLHPDDQPGFREIIETAIREKAEWEADYRIVPPGGPVKDIHVVGHPVLSTSGHLVEFVGTVIDVTERKRAEQERKRLQAHLTEAQKLTHTGSWGWRVTDRNAMEVSEEFYRIYGFDPAEGAPTLEEYLERVHPEDRLKWTGITERAIVEKADYDHEFRILLPNGKAKWIRTVGHPVLSDIGDLEGFIGSSTDITERKAAEQEREKLQQLEADLAHTDRVSTLGEMAASLAHEIKQPIAAAITSANSCLEWLAHEPPNLDRARAAAARIDKYGNRAAEIIDRIRSFYKKSPPQRELVDVNGIIHEMLTLLEGEARRSSIAMRTELDAELPKIMVDRVQLQQVFMNLMLNAIEAMADSGGGELTLKSQLQEGQLRFSVSDTGVGLPTEKMDQIFSAFFTTKPRGSGMGLAISRSIVESHGGHLWASPNSGGGATFHFTLPIQVTESAPLVA
jgi:PAS domain S-box-containing protein